MVVINFNCTLVSVVIIYRYSLSINIIYYFISIVDFNDSYYNMTSPLKIQSFSLNIKLFNYKKIIRPLMICRIELYDTAKT